MGDRPNVVVIVADTFRRDHLGAYSNGQNIDPAAFVD
jgi:arylsulfatase A-like enzyme